MKISALLLAAALVVSATAQASAQSLITAASTGQPGGSPHVSQALAHTNSHYFTRRMGLGSLTYFEAVPTHDAQHEQFAQLRQAFETAKPTVMLYQYPDLGVDSTEATTISNLGESGYTRYLAQQHRVATERLDDPVAEYEYVRANTKADAEQLKLYYLLREIQRFQARTGARKAVTMQAMQQLITNSAYFLPGTEQAIRNMAEFETAYRKHCPTGGKWYQVSASCFSVSPAAAGQRSEFMANISRTIGEYRTQRLNRLVAEKTRAGERVMVVVSPDYLPVSLSQAFSLAAN